MRALSFFGSAQVNLKMPQRKTFSIATTEMSQVLTIVTTLVRGRNEERSRADDCGCDHRSFQIIPSGFPNVPIQRAGGFP